MSCLTVSNARAQTTSFTYQGKLADGGLPANGSYDFQFKLFDALTGGAQQGPTVTVNGVTVTGGIFTVNLDFGANFPGSDRFLEISVKQTSGGTFSMLGPRQQVTSTPYAIRSLNTATADGLSLSCVGCVTSSQIQSVQGAQITGTLPVASLPAGNANYIQNTTSQQASSNFNVSGNGTVAGTLSGNVVSATTQYTISGNHALSITGAGPNIRTNTFAGVGAGSSNTPSATLLDGNFNSFYGRDAGTANTTGDVNSFFGASAGRSNVTGSANSFFGVDAGESNTTGVNNSFFGFNAGLLNTTGFSNVFAGDGVGSNNTTGFNNSFFGSGAGSNNTTGSNNTLIGFGANLPSGSNLTFATAIGSAATVATSNTIVLGRAAETVQVPGTLAVSGTLSSSIVNAATQYNIGGNRVLSVAGTQNVFAGVSAGAANTGANNAFFGSSAGQANTSGSSNSFFGSAAGLFNTTGQNNAFFGFAAGSNNSTGNENSFFGGGAGQQNTTGSGNSFFGILAGVNNTSGNGNAFFGRFAGEQNTTGNQCSFFGAQAGSTNSTGFNNSFFGALAGQANTTGDANSFFGLQAGKSNTDGFSNSFFGTAAGSSNTTSGNNSFFGAGAGSANTTGSNNTFLGLSAGSANVGGSNNTYLGFQAGGSASLTNAAAVGANASVASNNSLVLGSINGINGATADTKVGIGTPAPSERLTVQTANGNYGFIHTDGTITVGSFVGGSANGGWFGTKSNHTLNFFVNDGPPSMQIDTSGIVHVVTLGAAGATSLCRNSLNHISTCSSSLRYKTDVSRFLGGLEIINRLRPIAFTWKVGGARDIGLGAEEVDKVEPLLTFRNDKDEIEGVKYNQLSAVFINAFKEQQAQIKEQQDQMERQRRQLAAQQSEIAGLKRLFYDARSRRIVYRRRR